MKNNRIEWLDISKGIGMILVILGHCVGFGGLIHNLIFMFHMPLFFILSGYIFKRKENIQCIISKFKSLIIPYFILALLGLIITIIIPQWRQELTLKGIISDLYLMNPDTVNISSIWFLVCLFWVTIIYNLISKFSIKLNITIISALFILGTIYSKIREKFDIIPLNRLPFDLDVVLIAIFFFAIASILSKGKIINLDKICNIKIMPIYIGIVILCLFVNKTVNMHGLTLENPILYIMGGFAGSIIVIYISKVIEKYDLFKIKHLLLWMGRNTLVMLGIQSVLVRIYILIIKVMFEEEYSLYFLPAKHQICCFVFTMIFTVLITYIWNVIKGVTKIERKKV